jgi:hypothetical protein
MEQAKSQVESFRQILDQPLLLQMKIVSSALMVGPLIFGVVAVSMPSQEHKDMDNFLTIINFALLGMNILLAYFLPKIMMTGVDIEADKGLDLAAVKIRTSHIGRLALMEASALFGTVVAIISSDYLNFLTFIPLLIVFVVTFPTKRSLTVAFIRNFMRDERLLIEFTD